MEDCSTDERLQQETLCHQQWTVPGNTCY